MIRILRCITGEHDLSLVVLAAILCGFACLTAVNLIGRAAGAQGYTRQLWLAGAGFVAGGAIWATHFVAMLAFRPELPFGYDIHQTIGSVVIAISLCWLGLQVALQPDLTMVAVATLDSTATDAGHDARAKKGSAAMPMIGGAIMGIAIASMHFVGMAALRVPGDLHWDTQYVLVSIIIGIGGGALAISTILAAGSTRNRVLGGGILVFAICGLHFTAMSALTIELDPTVAIPNAVLDPKWLAISIAIITILIAALALTCAMVDRHLALRSHQEEQRLRAHIVELEATQHRLEETSAQLMLALEAAAVSSQSKSQFLATMSHELRTPLNAIIGFSSILSTELYGPLGDARYRDHAQDVQKSGEHLLSLINDILDFTKVDGGHLELNEEPVEISQVIAESLRMVRNDSNIDLRTQAAANLPIVRVDRRRIRQVMLNLLSNALKFTPEDGTIDIFAGHNEDGITITVADTGIGIAPENLALVLERFGQVDHDLNRKHQGAGLGLPLSKRLVELHGGSLQLESTLGIGTTVIVKLPANRFISDRQVA